MKMNSGCVVRALIPAYASLLDSMYQGQRQCQYWRGDGGRGCEDLKAFSLEERLGSAVIGFRYVKDLDSNMAICIVSSWVLAQKFYLGI